MMTRHLTSALMHGQGVPRSRCHSALLPAACHSRNNHHIGLRRSTRPCTRIAPLRRVSPVKEYNKALRGTASEEFAAEVAATDHPWKEWVHFEVEHQEGGTPAAVARRVIGMGTWLTHGMLAPPFEFLVSEIEGLWRQILGDRGFRQKQMDPKFKMLDSMDKDGEKGEDFTRESENPLPSDPEQAILILVKQGEGMVDDVDTFSKLHIGVGIRQDGVQFAHCAMIPREEYNLPIYAVDIIGLKQISLARVDLYPVTNDLSLPDIFMEGMSLLQKESIESNRPHPAWANQIGSSKMISFSVKNDDDAVRFLSYAALLCKAYMKTAEITESVTSLVQTKQIKTAHSRFLVHSLEQEQLRNAIGKSFGDDWTKAYLTNCFFPI